MIKIEANDLILHHPSSPIRHTELFLSFNLGLGFYHGGQSDPRRGRN